MKLTMFFSKASRCSFVKTTSSQPTSSTLINSRFYQRGRFFWDERASTLEEQVLMPFQDPVEMGMTLDQVVSAVQEQDFYRRRLWGVQCLQNRG